MINGKICILLDKPRFGAHCGGQLLTGYDLQLLMEKCARAGIAASQVVIESISQTPKTPDAGDEALCIQRLNKEPYVMIVPLDEKALQFVTGKKSIWKWHLSPLDTLPAFNCHRAVPSFHPDQIKKEWYLSLYLEMALRKAHDHASLLPWQRKQKNYRLVGIDGGPSYDEAIHILESIRTKDRHSLDIETGRNQINTFGIAWSASDAIAIKILPDLPTALHHKLWSLIVDICESDSEKIAQNGIYEQMYCSRYGFFIRNFKHDTMCANKFLWPELEKGLDNVGRIYTMEPYWKDDGRVSSEEGKQKDWGNIRDWPQHLTYNCSDTSNTLIASEGQRADLAARGMLKLFDGYIQKLFDKVTYEMGANGLPCNPEKQKTLIAQYEAESAAIVARLSEPINPRSPKQKLKLLRDKGYKLPIKRATGKESVDELSLKKLRLKHPDDTDIKNLLEVAGIEKALSSYLRVRTLSDNRIRFMVDAHGTETGRFSCSKDPWGGGFNGQTMTDYVKNMIEWKPEDDRVFMEFDLEQAETRFVAYDACESTLLGMLERNEDVHSHVAANIFKVSIADVIAQAKRADVPTNEKMRQLGKKSGHGANYNMGVNTFIDSCLKEMDLVLDKPFATRTLEAYHQLFPGIRRWHANIRNTLYRERKLTNPLGRARYFYGRMDDNTYREGYAYRPQSTVPDVANHLMLGLLDRRIENAFDFRLHLQVHDSVLLSCRKDQMHKIAQYAFGMTWHPKLILPAGQLIIPISCKFGTCLGSTEKLKIA